MTDHPPIPPDCNYIAFDREEGEEIVCSFFERTTNGGWMFAFRPIFIWPIKEIPNHDRGWQTICAAVAEVAWLKEVTRLRMAQEDLGDLFGKDHTQWDALDAEANTALADARAWREWGEEETP